MMKRYTQDGAITLWLAAALMSLVLFSAAALDLARLTFQRQQLQSVADMAAMKIMQNNPHFLAQQQKASMEAELLAEFQPEIDDIRIALGRARIVNNHWTIDTSETPEHGYSAAKVVVYKTVPQSMIAGGLFNNQTMTLTAEAATHKNGFLRFAMGSYLAQMSLQKPQENDDEADGEAERLNKLFYILLGTDLGLTVASYQGLAQSTIRVGSVLTELALNLGLGSPQEVLETQISLRDILTTYLNVLSREEADSEGLNQLLDEWALVQTVPNITLGDILTLSKTNTDGAALSTSLNALDLITSTIYASNAQHFVEIPEAEIDITGVSKITVKTNIISPPSYRLATLPVISGHEPEVKNAQVELELSADLELLDHLTALTSLVGLQVDASPITMRVKTSEAKATLMEITTQQDRFSADFMVHSSLASVVVEPIIVDIRLLPLINLTATLEVEVINEDPEPHLVTLAFTNHIDSASHSHITRDNTFDTHIDIRLAGLGTLPGVSETLSSVVGKALSTILSEIITPQLEVLGISLGGADIWVESINTSSTGLIM
ncbi:pilus assembly protein TadG-related protein [Vibrio cincinnatiensis]|uniref:pilus assembly protein TadG-related protein n=1 Tax=Vibrio cincinnatiensis TaxID=675 RepID=UPI0012ACB590|nr:pilus assembly protein TadG-related protein [Vibrio cincinnatiensis]